MMNIVQSTDLREVTSKRFVVVASVINSFRPIVSPFYHRARFQTVAAYLIFVRAVPLFQRWPITERQQILQMARPQVIPSFLEQSLVSLRKLNCFPINDHYYVSGTFVYD